jgi:Mrp family chromosome partitioning ATPase
MSKNYELMKLAEIGCGDALGVTIAGIGAETTHNSVASTECMTPVEPLVREELLKLVQRLFLIPEQAPPKAVMFAAIDARTKCNRLCAITAELLAESVPGSVCLVEGNFRSPSLPGMFGMANHLGLADSLRQDGPIRGFARQLRRGNLWLLSSGSLEEDALNLLNCERMKERIAELRSEFDYLLIDVPPLNVYADAMVFGRLADGVLLVLEANATRRESALRIAQSLRSTRIPVLGAVLNGRTFPIPGSLYKRL